MGFLATHFTPLLWEKKQKGEHDVISVADPASQFLYLLVFFLCHSLLCSRTGFLGKLNHREREKILVEISNEKNNVRATCNFIIGVTSDARDDEPADRRFRTMFTDPLTFVPSGLLRFVLF